MKYACYSYYSRRISHFQIVLHFFYVSRPLMLMSVSKTLYKGLTPHSEWALLMIHWNFSCSFLSQKGKQYCYLRLWEKHQKPTMRLKHFVGVKQAPREIHSLRHCYSTWAASKLRGEENSITYVLKVLVWTLHLEVLKSYERKWHAMSWFVPILSCIPSMERGNRMHVGLLSGI